MTIGVRINLENIYSFASVSDDLKIAVFQTQLQNGKSVPLLIKISDESHSLLPNVYNMTFGPLNRRGLIDDKAELPHRDYSKVFSTILSHALKYLTLYSDQQIGIDGSDNYRAYYYWRFLQRNLEYLNRYFNMFTVKYYVRITRYGKHQYDNPFDFDDILSHADRIVKTNDQLSQMYNYFTFGKKRDL